MIKQLPDTRYESMLFLLGLGVESKIKKYLKIFDDNWISWLHSRCSLVGDDVMQYIMLNMDVWHHFPAFNGYILQDFVV